MVNEELREKHFAQITDERARDAYDMLCDACDRRPDGLTEADQMMIRDVAYSEQVKGMLMADILERGIGTERYNGRQKYWQDNKSLANYRNFCESQRKLLAELKLTPNSRKAAAVEIDDDFDSFPD